VVPLSIPLVLGALAEVDERALALEARGAGSPARHTPLNPPPDSIVDRAVRWSLLFVVLLAVGVRIAS
jgi:energy-coupling factor transport system permease protein